MYSPLSLALFLMNWLTSNCSHTKRNFANPAKKFNIVKIKYYNKRTMFSEENLPSSERNKFVSHLFFGHLLAISQEQCNWNFGLWCRRMKSRYSKNLKSIEFRKRSQRGKKYAEIVQVSQFASFYNLCGLAYTYFSVKINNFHTPRTTQLHSPTQVFHVP